VGGVTTRFGFRVALLAYLIAVATLVGLTVGLGLLVTGEVPTAGGYKLICSIALVSCLAVAVIVGRLAGTSWVGAVAAGVVGGVSLVALICVAAYVWGRLVRAA
jgi:hypothetical protein